MAPKRKAPEEQKIATVLKKLHVTQQSFKLLSEALHHPLSDLPEDCRQMLLAGLPFSVCVFQDERRVPLDERRLVDPDGRRAAVGSRFAAETPHREERRV
ncbi:unnamed protein product [Durusdinium trenchii]|uniref:Uncharacterized protein n=1 Tax=Durusdinium trenchii TaxID=1381693 RepID=A0ABP0HM38_9DINO